MELFIAYAGSIESLADQVAKAALDGCAYELREGLNLGGGEYIKFYAAEGEVLLVCNDTDHGEVFIPEKAGFRFYCYSRGLKEKVLQQMRTALTAAGLTCEIADCG